MGIYHRHDSPFYWMVIERPHQKPLRQSTGVPLRGGSPARDKELKDDAQRVYALTKARSVLAVADPSKPIIDFAAYTTWYESHVVTHRRSATRERSMLKNLRASFGHHETLTAIDAHAVQEWMTSRRKAGRKPATVNRELDVLKAMLTSAVPKYLERSPLGTVRRFRIPESEPRVLTMDEERRMLDACSDDEAAMIQLAIDTLMRLSNIVNLRWAQVKWTQATIVPLNAKVSHDAVPITRRCFLALEKLSQDEDWVFPALHRGKGESAAKNAAIRLFDELCQKAGLAHGRAANGLTFHCLRHTGATRALQRGASVRTVMKLGGWKDERTVMRYTHATDADVRQAAESISAKPILFTPRARGARPGR